MKTSPRNGARRHGYRTDTGERHIKNIRTQDRGET